MADPTNFRIPLALARPDKPWSEMTDDERAAFASAMAHAAADQAAKVDQAVTDARIAERAPDYEPLAGWAETADGETIDEEEFAVEPWEWNEDEAEPTPADENLAELLALLDPQPGDDDA